MMMMRVRSWAVEECGGDSGAETAESDCSRMSSASSDFLQEDGQDPFQMTVHLLANPGESQTLQHILDCLLQWLSPEIQLFHVSERAAPVKCARSPSKKSGYPSLSVILFFHEDFGEERILQVHDFFQGPPWSYHHSESVGGKILPYMICCQDFYSLDANMPIWAVRQVHYGSEILRVTLCCSYENFEDAVKLYELILQSKATVQKSDFCCFTLYSNQSFCIQLSLKQLPLGVSVNLKESAVLQFRVQAIGELVPLLPNPCVPISNTRWQTEDYDGNKILFQVRENLKHLHGNCSASQVPSTLGSSDRSCGSLPCHQRSTPDKWASSQSSPHDKSKTLSTLAGDRCERRHPKGKKRTDSTGTPDKNESSTSDSLCSTPRSSSCYSSQRSSPATLTRCDPPTHGYNTSAKLREPGEDATSGIQIAETDVDTGFVISKPDSVTCQSGCCLGTFSPDLKSSLPNLRANNRPVKPIISTGLKCAKSCENSTISGRVPLTAIVGGKDLDSCQKSRNIQHVHASVSIVEEEEEEFFI